MNAPTPDSGEDSPRAFRVKHAGLALAVALAVAVGAIFTAAGGDDAARKRATVLALAPANTVVVELSPIALDPPPAEAAMPSPVPEQPAIESPAPEAAPAPVLQALALPRPTAPPRAIAVVIDDMGIDRARSRRAIALPGPLTMAVLPFASGAAELAAAARAAGHQVIAHLPMEALEPDQDPGPMALVSAVPEAELVRRLRWHLDRYDFAGASNHMGSRFTADARRMGIVLGELKARGMFWLDSRTNGRSVGECLAHKLGVETTARDVFLDNDPGAEAITAALRQVEQIARRHGRAVAIGHPRESTLIALQQWLPRLRREGFDLVPVSAMLSAPNPACKS